MRTAATRTRSRVAAVVRAPVRGVIGALVGAFLVLGAGFGLAPAEGAYAAVPAAAQAAVEPSPEVGAVLVAPPATTARVGVRVGAESVPVLPASTTYVSARYAYDVGHDGVAAKTEAGGRGSCG